MMVMRYIKNGSMSQYLKSNYNGLDLGDKLSLLNNIARGLKEIHNKGFVHKDLHSGNILNYGRNLCLNQSNSKTTASLNTNKYYNWATWAW